MFTSDDTFITGRIETKRHPGAGLKTETEQSPRGIAVKPDRFAPFITDVEVARHAPLPTRADLRGTSIALAVDAQLRWTTLRAARAPEPPGEPGVPAGSAPPV
ncbi:hypothetical protein [Burkholderia sp. BCC0405]|uniref:hypothetical protein n=1 Tax=Burkholderia sp. BCC0405 TaxID=2676298 RepID=UPI00158CC965|nr:hypothetical protein [Burkholderia sp. BCC0405]